MFKSIGRWFKNTFKKALRIFNSFMTFVFSEGLDIFIAEFKDIAMIIVRELETADLNNDDKRNEAFNRIEDIVIGRGTNYENNWIQILIPIALQAVRKIAANYNK